MLPLQRQQRIKEIIEARKSVKISDLSNELAVSEMTIHRDLKPLIEDGFVIKTFGGITLTHQAELEQVDHNQCVFCRRKVKEKFAYKLILANNQLETACCAHCGLLRHYQLRDEEVQALTYDFLRETTIPAYAAYYIVNTSLDIGCCQPQILAFEWKEHAEKFVKGFGGEVHAFNEAQEVVLNKMHGKDDQCHR